MFRTCLHSCVSSLLRSWLSLLVVSAVGVSRVTPQTRWRQLLNKLMKNHAFAHIHTCSLLKDPDHTLLDMLSSQMKGQISYRRMKVQESVGHCGHHVVLRTPSPHECSPHWFSVLVGWIHARDDPLPVVRCCTWLVSAWANSPAAKVWQASSGECAYPESWKDKDVVDVERYELVSSGRVQSD